MKFIRSIAMNTDHSFYGRPTEVTCIELYLDEDVTTPEVIEIAKRLQVERLHRAAKAMPHRFWQLPDSRPYSEELK